MEVFVISVTTGYSHSQTKTELLSFIKLNIIGDYFEAEIIIETIPR